MDILYAPWRNAYVAKTGTGGGPVVKPQCPFCIKERGESDAQMFLVKRYQHCFVMMNLYPYNAGHLLVLPYRHVAQLSDLTLEERAEFFEVMSHAVTTITKVVNAHGTNVGMNLGKAAGAGVPDHLHLHIVPRWIGDSNFLPVIAKTKQISVDLFALYGRLVEAF